MGDPDQHIQPTLHHEFRAGNSARYNYSGKIRGGYIVMKVILKINNHTGDMEAYTTLSKALRSFDCPPDYQKTNSKIKKHGQADHLQFTIKIVYYAN